MVKKIKKEIDHIFAVIDEEEEKLLGYFKSMQDVQIFFEKENIDHARILTVISVEDAEYPPEPMLEFTQRNLFDVLSGE